MVHLIFDQRKNLHHFIKKTDIFLFQNISVCMGIYPSIRAEYPSERENIRQFALNIRLYGNISVNSCRISVCTGIYPSSSAEYPSVCEYNREFALNIRQFALDIRLYGNISVYSR